MSGGVVRPALDAVVVVGARMSGLIAGWMLRSGCAVDGSEGSLGLDA